MANILMVDNAVLPSNQSAAIVCEWMAAKAMIVLANLYHIIVRTLAWSGVAAIIILSVIPAEERPVPGNWISVIGHELEHFAAFALVAGIFAIGYRFTLIRLMLLALLFCGGIELLQISLPSRHVRVSDFVIDFIGACFAIGLVAAGEKFLTRVV